MPTTSPVHSPPHKTAKNCRPKLIFDWREWLPYLETQDATEAEKRACIEAIWVIVLSFVDLDWEIAAREESCGQDLDLAAAFDAVMVNLEISEQEREDA